MDKVREAPYIHFMVGDNEVITFSVYEDNKNGNEINGCAGKKLHAVLLEYSYILSQDDGITPILRAFDTDEIGRVRKIPNKLKFRRETSFIIVKYGKMGVPKNIYELAEAHGISGLWNSNNFVICFSKPYFQLASEFFQMIKYKKAIISQRYELSGPALYICSI